MKYEVTVLCAICQKEIRRYTTTVKPPGEIKLEAHGLCQEAELIADIELAYAQDAIHGRQMEMN